MFKLGTLIVGAMISFSSAASVNYTVCSNGEVDEVGDRLVVIAFAPGRLEIQLYETFFDLYEHQVTTEVTDTGVLFTSVNQEVLVTSEGAEWTSVVNLDLVWKDGLESGVYWAELGYSLGSEPTQTVRLDCNQVYPSF